MTETIEEIGTDMIMDAQTAIEVMTHGATEEEMRTDIKAVATNTINIAAITTKLTSLEEIAWTAKPRKMTIADAETTEAGRKSKHLEIALPAMTEIGAIIAEKPATTQESSDNKGRSTVQEGIGRKKITRQKK